MEKLVRDKIPEIVKSKGEKCNYYIASDLKYTLELQKKLYEEVIEVNNSTNKDELIEELADVIEVINSICKDNGINIEDIEKIRLEKKEKRGGFDKKYILKMDD